MFWLKWFIFYLAIHGTYSMYTSPFFKIISFKILWNISYSYVMVNKPKKRAFPPLEIGTKKEKFLENVKSAVQFRLVGLIQWFPNCGTRKPSRWYTNRPTFCFSSQENTFTAIIFTCRVLLINSWIFVAFFPPWFLKMAIILSHSHFLHVAFVSIVVFQTFDRMIFGTLTFSGTRWYVLTIRTHKWYATRKSLGTTGLMLAMTVFLPIWHSHCTRVRFTVLVTCSYELAVH